jgi:hypothetical protein
MMKVVARIFAALLAMLSSYLSIHRADAYSVEFKRIYFPPGRPLQSESSPDIDKVLDQEQMNVLLDLHQTLKEDSTIGAEVMGFADKNECLPRECRKLSLRRAKMVFDWLLDHDIPLKQLRGPSGESIDWPLDDGETEDGRALNRRVQLEPYSLRREGTK